MTQRSILITGCSSGIGLDAARTLHARGWRVLATCRQAADCERLQQEGLESFVLDYASSESVQAAARQALELTGGKLDALFNNGAYAIPGLVEDLPRNALQTLFETNVFGQFELINALLPSMRSQGHGRIINCSSVLGFAALPFRGAYVASKFAMEGLSDTLRIEMRHTPIHVVLIEPGPIGTNIRQNSIPHFERWINWQDSARRADYESILRPRLYEPKLKKDRFELAPAAVTDKLIHALESTRPRPRYYVTTPTWIAGILKRILSTRWLDRVMSR
ncbi:SDR family NAD(P)-dependent oxidoreductase [Granulosicoccus antarcticus]|uniref:D-beta-hydroxybutyrate dehydrogenase n=1 Tax=Granulosicoccus antarcticus IMCC3135 TaxID=1192854 RepID=A0A2Z2NJQ3_9GAMM|nr:SDR family NAD(P)-dependent oxidoreductase [Granulosicoccus antarcticus]ASJ71536.1 D-beta-hydroxybutyrate dehydrogenase [Granulosicoccus antarcticus IMCC3135]